MHIYIKITGKCYPEYSKTVSGISEDECSEVDAGFSLPVESDILVESEEFQYHYECSEVDAGFSLPEDSDDSNLCSLFTTSVTTSTHEFISLPDMSEPIKSDLLRILAQHLNEEHNKYYQDSSEISHIAKSILSNIYFRRARTQGAAIGFFERFGVPKDLAQAISNDYFTMQDGDNVALTSKRPANCAHDCLEEAKKARVKI